MRGAPHLGQILVESSLLLSARHGEDWGLGFARFLRGSQHWCQSVVVRSWNDKWFQKYWTPFFFFTTYTSIKLIFFEMVLGSFFFFLSRCISIMAVFRLTHWFLDQIRSELAFSSLPSFDRFNSNQTMINRHLMSLQIQLEPFPQETNYLCRCSSEQSQ